MATPAMAPEDSPSLVPADCVGEAVPDVCVDGSDEVLGALDVMAPLLDGGPALDVMLFDSDAEQILA